mgnify:CR=1 FL=1
MPVAKKSMKVVSKSKKAVKSMKVAKKVVSKSKKSMKAKKSKKVAKKAVSKSKNAVHIKGMKVELIGRCHNGRCVFLKRKTPINSSMLRK